MGINRHIFHGLDYKVSLHVIGNKWRTCEKERKQSCNAGTSSQEIRIPFYKKAIRR